jgi:hypothetical protein
LPLPIVVFCDLFFAVADRAGVAALAFKADPVLTVGAPCCAARSGLRNGRRNERSLRERTDEELTHN